MGHRTVLDVYGGDYPTKDGTPVRDFIHVSDLAVAHVRALEYLIDGGRSVALNLGTGRGYTVREVVDTVEHIGGRPVPVRMMARRPGDPPALVADATLAATTLRWAPVHSTLEEIVGTAWAWHNRNEVPAPLATYLDVASGAFTPHV